MKLSDFSDKRIVEGQIEEAGGWFDQKIRSRVGTKLSKTKAHTRITDKQRAEQLWDAWLEVTGGTGEFDLRELVSWLIKEVRIDGVNIDQNIITKALREAAFAKELKNDQPGEEPKQAAEPDTIAKKAPDQEPAQVPVEPKQDPEKTEPEEHPATGGFVSLDLPAINSTDREWIRWADQLSSDQPQLFIKLAKSLGAKISSTNLQRKGKNNEITRIKSTQN